MRYGILLVVGVMAGIGARVPAQGQVSPQAAAAAGITGGGQEARSNAGRATNYTSLEERQGDGLGFIGKVAVEGATPPWDPIPVIVTCNGVVRYRTEADAKGQFTIRGNQSPSESVAAEKKLHQEWAAQLIGCNVNADVPGFKSSTVRIANREAMGSSDIGTITLRPDSATAGTSESATTAAAPKEAMKHFDKARSEWLSRNANGAERDLEKAVKIDPQFAEAWYQLGKLQQLKNDNDKALASYQKVVAADPKFVSPYEPIAELSATGKKWQDVANATSAALKLDPAGTPQLWYYDALGKYNLGQVDDAEASARKSLAMDPQHVAPNTEQLLAVMLAGQGQLEEALKHLQNSLTYVKPGPNAELIKQQIAQLEKVLPPSETPTGQTK